MAFYQCRIKYNLAHIIEASTTLVAAGNGIDFRTGDISGGYTGIHRAYDPGTSQGSTLSANEAAAQTVISVTSTTGMATDEMVGIELNNGNTHWSIMTVDSSTQITLDVALPSAADSGNNIVSTGQLESTTTGSIVQDFHFPKVLSITNRTGRLLNRGVTHAGFEFAANEEIRTILSVADNSTLANGSFFVFDRDNVGYAFVDASDYNTFVDSVATRVRLIYNNSGGQMNLVGSVLTADNTLTAMDAISDSRT